MAEAPSPVGAVGTAGGAVGTVEVVGDTGNAGVHLAGCPEQLRVSRQERRDRSFRRSRAVHSGQSVRPASGRAHRPGRGEGTGGRRMGEVLELHPSGLWTFAHHLLADILGLSLLPEDQLLLHRRGGECVRGQGMFILLGPQFSPFLTFK